MCMDAHALLSPDADLPLGQSRAHVLDLLRAAGSPVGVQEIAGRAGLHPNTARFHLDALVEAGLAARAPAERATPGRPSMTYRAVEGGGPAGRRHYRLLAEMLTSLIAGMMPQPGEAAAEAGREWGPH
jgi:predicted ArsR family transcriptional regulator